METIRGGIMEETSEVKTVHPLQEMFAERLTSRRVLNQMTQLELSVKTGINKEHINHFECKRRLPNVANLVRLSQGLRVSTDWLLGLV